jgi:hypothetical protein
LVDDAAEDALQGQGFDGEGGGPSPLPSPFIILPSSFPAPRVYSSRKACFPFQLSAFQPFSFCLRRALALLLAPGEVN